jgi:hypothetical protein
MAYTSWGSAFWSTSSADGLCVGGNHVASVVASVAVPNQLSLLRMGVRARAQVRVRVVVAEAASGVALIVVAVVASVEVVVGSVEDAEEEGTVTEGDLETGEAVVSEAAEVAALEEVGMTSDHREVVAIGSCFAD